MKGAFHSPVSQSLSKFPSGKPYRPYSEQLPRGIRSHSPTSLSLDRSAAGGRLTPNSQLLSQSVSSRRFVPIDQMYLNTMSRSVASDPNTFGTVKSASSVPMHHHETSSYQNTPMSQHKVIRPLASRQSSHQSYHGSTLSMASTRRTLSSEELHMHSVDLQDSIDSGLPNSTGSDPTYQNTLDRKTLNSMYMNLPAEGTLDRVHVNLHASEVIKDDHTYMDPMAFNSADRPKSSRHSAPPPRTSSMPRSHHSSPLMSSMSRSHDRRRKKGVTQGPRLYMNKRMSASATSINSLNSHFGDDKQEMTTPL